MEIAVSISIGLAILAVLLLGNMPISFALMAGAIFLLYFGLPNPQPIQLGMVAWNSLEHFVLAAVPLFLLMGELLLSSGISESVYRALSRWLDHVPGGLAHVNIALCALFAAASGSSVATAALIGTVALPSMDQRGYDKALTRGSVASGGTLGILIPPSIPMIIYANITGTSVGRLFIAGLIPGIVLSALFMAYIFLRAVTKPEIAPRSGEPFHFKKATSGLIQIAPVLILIVLVLGGIYLGVATPTEAAAVGVAGAALICLFARRLNWKVTANSLKATVQATSMIFLIMAGASMVNYFMAYMQVPAAMSRALTGHGFSPYMVLFLFFLIYQVLGCFLDATSIMVLTIPMLFPALMALGIDPIWFGIFLVINIEMGLLTPPVGMNLFVIQAIDPSTGISVVIRGMLPFFFIMCLMLVILVVFPSLALWLPGMMMG